MKLLPAAAIAAFVFTAALAAQANPPTEPTSKPAADNRPRLLIAGIQQAVDADPRDAWIATAVEEVLTWRLRRCPELATSPTQRAYQGRLEFGEPDAPTPDWMRIAAALGATHFITGTCRGDSRNLELTLTIQQPGAAEPAAPLTGDGHAPLWDALDRATDAVLARLGADQHADGKFRRQRPTETLNALELYARAVAASRNGDATAALRYVRDATDTDRRFRAALGLLAQLELKAPAGGRARASKWLRAILDLARADHDDHDRLNAELALSLIARSENAPQAAQTRAATALELAVALNDMYGRMAVVGWQADLLLVESDAQRTAATEPVAEDQAALRASVEYQRQLLDLLSAAGDRLTAIPANTKLAFTYERLGDDAAALAAHQRTLEHATALGLRAQEAGAWVFLAQFHRVRKQWTEARDAASRGLALADATTKPPILILLGSAYAGLGDASAALDAYQQAYDAVRGDTNLVQQFTCMREIARLRHEAGDSKGAIRALQEAIDLAKILEAPDRAALSKQLETWRAAGG